MGTRHARDGSDTQARAVRAAERAVRRPASVTGKIVVEEAANVAAAAEAGVEIDFICLRVGDALPAALAALGARVPVIRLSSAQLSGLFSHSRTPRVFAIARLPPPARLKALATRAGDLVVLDGVAGPGNIGSVVRSATAFDAAGMALLDVRHADIYRRATIRASAGALFRIPVVAMTTADLLRFCQRNNRTIVAASADAGDDVANVAGTSERLAIVFGSETRGLSDRILQSSARRLHVPVPGPVDSLNISTAAAIVLFGRHAARQSTSS